MFRAGLFAAAAVALAGCASDAEIAQRDDASCSAMGAQIGTPAYVNCRAAMASQRAANRQLLAARLYAAGSALMDVAPPPQVEQPATPIPAGFTKVCTYNTITGQRAVTVGSLDFCPLLPPGS